jgi:hypothetical protein
MASESLASGTALDTLAANYGIKREGRDDPALRRAVRDALTRPQRSFPSIDDGDDLTIMRHESPWVQLVLPLARRTDAGEELGFILHDTVNGHTPLVVVNDWRMDFFSGSWKRRIQYPTYEALYADGWRVYRQEWADARHAELRRKRRDAIHA